jgi:hypothetical protein
MKWPKGLDELVVRFNVFVHLVIVGWWTIETALKHLWR